jgi:hypothetical protein
MGDFQLSLKLINTHQKLICWCSFKNWKIYETCVCVCVCFFLIPWQISIPIKIEKLQEILKPNYHGLQEGFFFPFFFF